MGVGEVFQEENIQRRGWRIDSWGRREKSAIRPSTDLKRPTYIKKKSPSALLLTNLNVHLTQKNKDPQRKTQNNI